MDRIFLAVIVSGVLLIIASTSLFVLWSGDATTVAVRMPTAPAAAAEKLKRRQVDENQAGPPDHPIR